MQAVKRLAAGDLIIEGPIKMGLVLCVKKLHNRTAYDILWMAGVSRLRPWLEKDAIFGVYIDNITVLSRFKTAIG